MKLNNIFLVLGLLLILSTGCTTEGLVDENETGHDTSFSLTILTGEPATKANSAPGYQYATAEEILINNCAVAVFEMDGATVGNLVGEPVLFSAQQVAAASITTSDGKRAYTLTGLRGKTGKARILVIANANSVLSKSSFTSWKSFEEAFVTDASFVGSDLKKVGQLDVELAPSATKPIYAVPLAQLSARIDLKIEPVADANGQFAFVFNQVKVENINTESDLILMAGFNRKEGCSSSVFELNKATNAFSFYTYENTFEDKRIKITLSGTMTENGSSYPKQYSIILDRNVEHGTVYDVKGTYDLKTRQLKFAWTILPWSTAQRYVYVDIIKSAYLVVRDLELIMPNMKTISTTFESSSPVSVNKSTLIIENGSIYVNKVCTVTPSQGTSGNIVIKSELPTNFVPKVITFTVRNEENLEQVVRIYQYPSLYITSETANRKPSGAENQNNDKLYKIKTLVADFSVISTDRNDYQLDESGFTHSDYLSNRQATALGYANEIRNKAYSGFPLVVSQYYESVKSNIENSEKTIYRVTAGCTVEGDENNNRISPCFILASQNGINSIADSEKARQNCAGYYEVIRNADGTTTRYETGTWRVPTRAELMLIDILQNTEKCDVKKILEGKGYQHGLPGKLLMMDPRVSSSEAVRCVRDIRIK